MRRNPSLRLSRALCAAAAAVALTGCVGYQLGSMLPPDIQTVYVPTFVNKTSEPLIEVDTTRQVIQQLQRDGSLRVGNEANADAVLEVVLDDYELSAIGFEKIERDRADEYRATISASVTLTRKATGEIIVQRSGVKGESTFPFAADLSSAKRRALPEAARDLGHDIVELVTEAW